MANPSDNLDSLVVLFTDVGNYVSQFVPSINRATSAVEELEKTSVMIGNNICDQIRMSALGAGLSQKADQELSYHSAVLDNISQWLNKGNQDFVDFVNKNSSENRSIASAISGIGSNNDQQPAGNGGAGGRPESNNFKNIISGFSGGILTASASVADELRKFSIQLQNAYGKGGLQGFVGAIGVASSAVAAMPSAFGEVAKFAGAFVTALDPALMGKLALTIADLMAVIGIGLRPIIVMTIAVFRTFADILVPVMQRMSGAMGTLAQFIGNLAIIFIGVWANAINAMVPVIENLSALLLDTSGSFSILGSVINIIIGAVASTFNIVIAIMNAFIGTVKILGVMFYELAIFLEKLKDWIPGSGGSDQNHIDEITKKQEKMAESTATSFSNAGKSIMDAINGPGKLQFEKNKSVGAAAKQASYTGIADLGKNLMQAAFSSSSENIAKQQLNAQEKATGFLADIAGMLGIQIKGQQANAPGVRRA